MTDSEDEMGTVRSSILNAHLVSCGQPSQGYLILDLIMRNQKIAGCFKSLHHDQKSQDNAQVPKIDIGGKRSKSPVATNQKLAIINQQRHKKSANFSRIQTHGMLPDYFR